MRTRSTTRQSPNGEEDQVKGVPLIIPLTAPRITSAAHAALVKWRSDYKEYVDQTRRRCVATGADPDEHVVSVVDSFDENLKVALCELRWNISPDELTDERAMEEIDKIISSVKNRILPDVDALFAEHVRLDLSESDVEERVLQYFISARTLIKEHGLQGCFTGDKGKREYCKLMTDCLTPDTLKHEVIRETRWLDHEAKADEKKLHKKCKGNHWLSACNEATDEEKKRLPKEHAAARKNNGKQKKGANMKRVKECLHDDAKQVELNGLLQLPYCADTGSERTLLSRKHVNRLLALMPSIMIYDLPESIEGKAVGGGELTCTQGIMVQITLYTAAGKVHIAEPIECVILECEEDEFILGLDVLKTLGIDIQHQLEALAAPDPSDQDDPIPFDDDERLDQANRAELMKAVEILLQRALDNGFPGKLFDELKRVVYVYDIWRLALGRDPPARVPPLKVRLKDVAKPYKAKPRAYPPHLREFMQELNDELVRLGWVRENKSS